MFEWKTNRDHIDVALSDKIVRVRADQNLRDLLKSSRKASLRLAGHIRTDYRKKLGYPLRISRASLASEIRVHVLVDNLFYRMQKIIGKLPGKPFLSFVNRLKDHTYVIDCGESSVDNNRIVFDLLSKLPLRR